MGTISKLDGVAIADIAKVDGIAIADISKIIGQEAGSPFDPDAEAFFTAAGITDATQKSAVDTLVLALKSASIWTKMFAIYPFVGSTSTNHKYNLKDTTAYTLTFASGVTHSIAGMLINVGSAEYADTGFIPSSHWSSVSDASTGIYQSLTTAQNFQNWGVASAVGIIGWSNSGAGSLYPLINDTTYASVTSGSYADRIGFQQITRNTGGTSGKFLKLHNNVVTNPSFWSSGNTLSGSNIWIGRSNGGSRNGTSSNYFTFAYIGEGLSSTELDDYYTAVQAFNTTLSREHT